MLKEKIRKEIDKYINLTNEQQEALFNKALEEIKQAQKEYDPNIEGIIYQLATEIDEWF